MEQVKMDHATWLRKFADLGMLYSIKYARRVHTHPCFSGFVLGTYWMFELEAREAEEAKAEAGETGAEEAEAKAWAKVWAEAEEVRAKARAEAEAEAKVEAEEAAAMDAAINKAGSLT